MIYQNKLRLVYLSLFFCTLIFSHAQVPQGINYQAIARNASGIPLDQGTDVVVEFNLTNSNSGVYGEKHAATVGEFGLINLVIGDGTRTGSELFSNFDWTATPVLVQVIVDNETMGSPQPLQSVPYALHCATAESVTGDASPWIAGTNGYAIGDNIGIGIGASATNVVQIRSALETAFSVSQQYSGTASRNAIYARVTNNGTGTAVGIETEVSQNSNSQVFGHSTVVEQTGSGDAYGNWVSMQGVSGGNQIAYYAKFGGSSSGTVYGIFMDGEEANFLSSKLGIGITAPNERLEVGGNMVVSGEVRTINSADANMLCHVYGSVTKDGSIATGSNNFTMIKGSLGYYEITLLGVRDFEYTTHIVTITPSYAGKTLIANYTQSGGRIGVYLSDIDGNPEDAGFMFVVFKP